ncbi:NifB/NifX family molybdenum-iron cluster-binding protein [Thioalkalicoccus limnaeus]|uniref:NifB/NifX family molybdenum-iron cluster-binding protein n=1 Tax=Thioalkalicoccus limnaeus TaxID=120681 RepID=A0ABV4BGD7_9GAMM
MALERRLKVLSGGAVLEAPLPGMKVAFASSDMRLVDQHFGAATAFAIYALDADRCGLVEVAQFEAPAMDGNEDKLAARIAALEGCAIVYCQAVGASAIGQLLARGIQPIKVGAAASVSGLLDELRLELRRGPESWLARALARHRPKTERRFDAMEADGWHE